MAKKIYRTVVRYEILSEEPFSDKSGDNEDLLSFIARECIYGSWSGHFLEEEVLNEELEGKKAADAIIAQGSDTEFFNMDEEGNNLEEEET